MTNEAMRGERMNNNGVSHGKNERYLAVALNMSSGFSKSERWLKRSSRFSPQFGQRTSVAKQAVPQLGQMSSFLGVNNFFVIRKAISTSLLA